MALRPGQSYFVPLKMKGLLLTALPVLGEVDTLFEFEYSIASIAPVRITPMIPMAIALAVVFLIILCYIVKIKLNKKN